MKVATAHVKLHEGGIGAIIDKRSRGVNHPKGMGVSGKPGGRCGRRIRSMEIAGSLIEMAESIGEVLELGDEDMNDLAIGLQTAMGDQSDGSASGSTIALPDAAMDNEIDGAGFIFEGHEGDTIGGTGSLPKQDDSADFQGDVVFQGDQALSRYDAPLSEQGPEEADGMGPEGQARGAIIGEDLGEEAHEGELGKGLFRCRLIPDGQGSTFGQSAPQGQATGQGERSEGIGLGKPLERTGPQTRSAYQVGERQERPRRPCGNNPIDIRAR
jgi:hypothetical protein